MKQTLLTKIFKEYPPDVRELLQKVLLIEQQYITSSLTPNSLAYKEVQAKIDDIIEGMCKK
ncbi:MAG: hypothetical protein DHS20C20_17050 [Ardenticatenaceae bacterium]|nr:MAG: hypothetical protein DHS20C20_17050 [Ardenticatenaceae bacterium]